MESFLKDHKVSIEVLGTEAARLAGVRWMEYLKKKTKARCPHCGQVLSLREHFLSDFYIGGFALAHCDALLTRDRGIYRKYFADLKLFDQILKST
jgi:predicted nucleic acid-binding protein